MTKNLSYLSYPLPPDIQRLFEAGDFDRMARVIRQRLEDPRVPKTLHERLRFQLIIAKEIPEYYRLTQADMLAILQENINDFTEDELEALRDDGTLQGYLLRSVYHASLNALKKGANATAYRSWVAQQIEQSCYAHYDPDDSEVIRKLYSQEIAGQIDAAVESLSPKCREVFRMSHIEGLSNREISERLGITLSTVENHIYNALKQLRQKLSHYKMLILLTMYILGR